MYVLDTNAIIYYTDDEPAAVAALEPLFAANHSIYISTLTELELFSHASLTEEETIRLETFLDAVHILPLTSQIARLAGDLRRAHAQERQPPQPSPAPAHTARLSPACLVAADQARCRARSVHPSLGLWVPHRRGNQQL